MSFSTVGDSDAYRRMIAGGASHMEAQRKHVEEIAAKEAADRAANGDPTLPEGSFHTKAEALVYLDAQRAAGRFPQAIDDGTGNGDFTVEIPYGDGSIWVTAVSDTEFDTHDHIG